MVHALSTNAKTHTMVIYHLMNLHSHQKHKLLTDAYPGSTTFPVYNPRPWHQYLPLNQECGQFQRGVGLSICPSVAKLVASPPMKCLIFTGLSPTNRIKSAINGCTKDWQEVKNRAQHLFAIETDYVRERDYCFVHAAGGSPIVTEQAATLRSRNIVGWPPPDPFLIAIPYPVPAYANGKMQEAVNALLARPRQQSSTALVIGKYRYGDAEKKAASKLRAALLAACQSEPSCEPHHPDTRWPNAPLEIYATVDYCLMPPGDTATRAGWFHALSGLCVPVFFSSCLPLSDGRTHNRSLVYDSMYAPLLPFTHRMEFGAGMWSVVLDAERALKESTYVFDALRAVNASAMRATIATFVHRLQSDNIRTYISERMAELY